MLGLPLRVLPLPPFLPNYARTVLSMSRGEIIDLNLRADSEAATSEV
jgi:hypothetical protein